MIEMSCPKCGGAGRIPREKLNTRLVCKKCLTVFHMTPAGRPVFGEPPVVTAKEERQRARDAAPKPEGGDWKDNLPEFTVSGRSAVISLVAVVVVGATYFLYSKPPESLADRAKDVTQTFADGDLGRLKDYATPGSVDDVVQWYGVVHQQFDGLRKQWLGRDPLVGVLVIEENLRQRSGQVTAIITPSKASSRVESISAVAGIGDGGSKTMELTLYFTPDNWGKWRLDGKKTLAAAPHIPL